MASAKAPAKKTAPAKAAAEASTPAAKKSTALVKWDEALLARAKIAAKTAETATSSGNFLSFKSGTLSYKGNPVEDDTLSVVVVSAVMENQFYEGDYDEGSPQSPLCYAFGTDEETIAPHEKVVKAGNAQAPRCAECQFNEWGSAAKGRGKACKNVFRLGMIDAEDAETAKKVETAPIFFAKTPVTSGKNWGNYVRSLESQGLPPLAFVTELAVVPAEKQFQVTFKAQERITEGEVIGALLAKADVLDKEIDFPYPDFSDEPKPQKVQARKPAPVVKKGGVAQPVAPARKVAPVKKAAKY